MLLARFVAFTFIVLLSACPRPTGGPFDAGPPERAPAGACRRSGCSGEVCAEDDVVTACVMKPEHACYRAAKCEKQPDGKCGFTITDSVKACLSEAKSSTAAPSLDVQ